MSTYPPPFRASARELVHPRDHTRPSARFAEWKPWHREDSSLAGHATIVFSCAWIVYRIPVFRTKQGGLSVGTPTIPEVDSEGRVRTREDGSRSYCPLIRFASGEARWRWQQTILAALQVAGVEP